MTQLSKMILSFGSLFVVSLLSGCSGYSVLDPKGPVALQQKDLIMLSIGFMLFIVAVVFVLFTIIIVKYRERPENANYDPPQDEGSKVLEFIWTLIPVVIVILLSVPTVKTIYVLEKAPPETAHKKPLVVHATSVDWKWIFTYPDQHIETVNYLHIPEDRPIKFKLTSADSMAALWIPRLGGQEYNMAGMKSELILQADDPGTYNGRNANFTGEGFADQRFKVIAQKQGDFDDWVKNIQQKAPKLTQNKYNHLMLQGEAIQQAFSSTHLKWVDHSKQADYAIKVRNNQNPDSQPSKPLEEKEKEKEKHSEH